MWFTLLTMAVAVSLEPFRIGMTLLMLNRPRPVLHLLVFLAGGFAMSVTVGMIALFLLRPAAASAHFTLPRVQIAVGLLLLVNAAAVAAGLVGKAVDLSGGRFDPLAARARLLLEARSVWAAGVAGLGIALPSVDYLAMLALIAASGRPAEAQIGALLVFSVVAFALVELPLVAFLVAPDRTRATLVALQDQLRTRGRRAVATLFAVVGALLLAVGVAGL